MAKQFGIRTIRCDITEAPDRGAQEAGLGVETIRQGNGRRANALIFAVAVYMLVRSLYFV